MKYSIYNLFNLILDIIASKLDCIAPCFVQQEIKFNQKIKYISKLVASHELHYLSLLFWALCAFDVLMDEGTLKCFMASINMWYQVTFFLTWGESDLLKRSDADPP